MKDLSELEDTMDILSEKYPGSVLYIRGDANSSPVPRSGNKRDLLFKYFLENNNLEYLPINHNTYHHFVNDGISDSGIDVILSSRLTSEGFPNIFVEHLEKVVCGKTNPLVDSSHDILISSVSFHPKTCQEQHKDGLMTAPRVPNTKHKIIWSPEGILAYQELLATALPALRSEELADNTAESARILFHMTNHILSSAAKATNKSVELSAPTKDRKLVLPPDIKLAITDKNAAHKALLEVNRNSDAAESEKEVIKNNFKAAKLKYQNAVRRNVTSAECARDAKLNQLLSNKPTEVFKLIKRKKAGDAPKIKALKVGNKIYNDDAVADGFYDSIHDLKTIKNISATSFEQFKNDHSHIIEICKAGSKIPRMSDSDALSLLKSIRPNVSDFFSITANHYLLGGEATLAHFKFMINTVLDNIEIAAIEEMNKAHAIILHKGHGKDKNMSSSYRIISSCPFIAKAADVYLGMLSKDDWSSRQAITQFQGEGMSHEMAALLLTSVIHNSVKEKKSLFVLLLDAKSAFDLVLRQILIRRLYLDTTPDQRILFWERRLSSRMTYCHWDGNLMGPINDELGVEQGGPNSSEHYKVYNNEQMTVAQSSGFGTFIKNVHIAAIGQADDTALVANDVNQLQHLLQLSLDYCAKYQVELSTVKTRLLAFHPKDSDYTNYVKLISPIHIGSDNIPFVDNAEHVGVLRSVTGNLPHIQQRMVNHRKALHGILFAGLSRRHRANPLSSIRADRIFGIPVLFSGLAALILKKSEVDILNSHVKNILQGLLKLYPKTPEPVIFLVAGTLPGEAILHQKQLTLFDAITRLPNNVLHTVAKETLISAGDNDTSWFSQIRKLCYQYNLPHPLALLHDPPSKDDYKRLIRANIAQFWQEKLRGMIHRGEAGELTSLKYFKPEYMSVLRPHPILTTSGHAYDINKMIVQLRMLSGRYRVGSLLRHFSTEHSGLCELCGLEAEDIVHLLVPRCPKLLERRSLLIEYTEGALRESQVCLNIFKNILESSQEQQVQFFLDCSVIPEVIQAAQTDNSILTLLFRTTRTWCYSLHRTRLKILGRW